MEGERLRRENRRFESAWDSRAEADASLEVGRDFDLAVLATGLAEIPRTCRSILARDARWRAMVGNVKTVATQALQLWLTGPMRDVGWMGPPVTITSFEPPFDTWADMTHLIEREHWPAAGSPGAVAYFCNVLDERQVAQRACASVDPWDGARDVVSRNARRFVARQLCRIWPGIADAQGQVDRSRLLDCRPEGSDSEDWLAGQYISANINPTDRYTLCLPGTPQYRISPLDRTYDNLTIAGDWTSCGLNLGCVESAVMSGMLAAHALGGTPTLEEIVGYDHL